MVRRVLVNIIILYDKLVRLREGCLHSFMGWKLKFRVRKEMV